MSLAVLGFAIGGADETIESAMEEIIIATSAPFVERRLSAAAGREVVGEWY